jgi:hypothetical protein
MIVNRKQGHILDTKSNFYGALGMGHKGTLNTIFMILFQKKKDLLLSEPQGNLKQSFHLAIRYCKTNEIQSFI